MKWLRCSLFALVLGAVQCVFAATGDTSWIYNDLVKDLNYPNSVQILDTVTDGGAVGAEADTGTKLDGNYINVDYKLNGGFFAFKVIMEYGTTAFGTTMNGYTYHSFMFSYKGLLPTQKATISWGASDGCGDAITIDSLATVTTSSGWRTVIVPIPTVRNGIREFRVTIHDINGAQTSATGNLKLDNIAFLTSYVGIIPKASRLSPITSASYFTPAADGLVQVSFFAVNGKLLMKKDVAVNAGKQYTVRDFALQHADASAAQLYFVKISGAGVHVLQQMRY